MAQGSMIAILLLKSKAELSAERLSDKLRAVNSKSPGKFDVASRDGAMLVSRGADVLTLMMMDCPVPAGTLDRAYDGNMTWPGAQELA